MKGYKQDGLQERPEARGGGDWELLGAIPNSKWCPVVWAMRVQSFHAARDPDGPYFLARDMRRPYTYKCAADDFKQRQLRVGVSLENLTTPHGLRVGGWNRTRAVLGRDVAKAHGGWQSWGGCSRYDRFSLALVHRIPAAIAGIDPGDDLPADGDAGDDVGEREVPIPQGNSRRDARAARTAQGTSATAVATSSSEAPPDPLLPPGWNAESRSTSKGRSYIVYVGPQGERARSRAEAWRYYDEADVSTSEGDDDDAGADASRPNAFARAASGSSARAPRWHYESVDHMTCSTVGCTFPRGHSGECSVWFPLGPRRG